MSFLRRPQAVFWRKAVFQIHLWVGVIAGLYVIAISVSGSALVFERELLNDAPAPEAQVADSRKRLDYQALLAVALAAHPGERLESIDMRRADRRIVQLVFKTSRDQHRNVWLDAFSGQVLADTIVEERHGVLSFLERLHNELLTGSRGERANGIGGALLFGLALTGLIVWWPGIRSWTRAITIQWRARWKRLTFDLHSAVGFWSLALVGMWGLSGFYFAFPQELNHLFEIFDESPLAKTTEWDGTGRLLPITSYLSQAERSFPGRRLAFLYMDVYRPGGQIAVFLSRNPERPLTLLEDIVRLDPANAQVLVTESSQRWSLKQKVAMASYSIHFGDFAGNWSKVLWLMLGLSPAALSISGFVMWWNRLLSKKWAALQGRQVERYAAVASRSEEGI